MPKAGMARSPMYTELLQCCIGIQCVEYVLDDSVCGVQHNGEYSRKFIFKGDVRKE